MPNGDPYGTEAPLWIRANTRSIIEALGSDDAVGSPILRLSREISAQLAINDPAQVFPSPRLPTRCYRFETPVPPAGQFAVVAITAGQQEVHVWAVASEQGAFASFQIGGALANPVTFVAPGASVINGVPTWGMSYQFQGGAPPTFLPASELVEGLFGGAQIRRIPKGHRLVYFSDTLVTALAINVIASDIAPALAST